MRSMPEPLPSAPLSATCTGELEFQPAPFGVGVSCALALGAVVSTTIAVLASDADGEALPIAYTVCAPSVVLGMVSELIVAVPAEPTLDGEPVSAVLESRR